MQTIFFQSCFVDQVLPPRSVLSFLLARSFCGLRGTTLFPRTIATAQSEINQYSSPCDFLIPGSVGAPWQSSGALPGCELSTPTTDSSSSLVTSHEKCPFAWWCRTLPPAPVPLRCLFFCPSSSGAVLRWRVAGGGRRRLYKTESNEEGETCSTKHD